MKTRDVFAVFNRGRVSRLALARTDVSRIALSAEVQKNWMPRVLGPMSLRPGLEYHGNSPDPSNGFYLPFIYDADDTAIIELTAGKMRIWENGDTLVEREGVSTFIRNGHFNNTITHWMADNDVGSSSAWDGVGSMELLGTGYGFARRYQEVEVDPSEEDTEHGLSVYIERGPVIVRIGSTQGDDDVFRQSVLRTGYHSLSFTPGGNFFLEFSSSLEYPVLVGDVSIEASGVMEVVTPWDTVPKCKRTRHTQSGDVVYVACGGVERHRIERRPNNSWSVVASEATNGPFQTENTSKTSLTPSGQTGEIVLDSSAPLFTSDHVGAIFRLQSQGQVVDFEASGENQWSDPIRVFGVGGQRKFTRSVTGTWSGRVRIQRSIGTIGAWQNYKSYTGNGSGELDDQRDNAIIYYRIGIDVGEYTSGTAECNLTYENGSETGVVRVTNYRNTQKVDGIVLDRLGGVEATKIWSEGSWSDEAGWPQATSIGDDGRLWWSGNGRNWGSIPDAFDNFDPDEEGDSAPINRSVGAGTTNTTNWMLPLGHLVVGTSNAEYSIRSTSFDEPVTPSNYNAKAPTTKGSAKVPAIVVDERGYFVGRDEETVYELEFDSAQYRYRAKDTTLLCPEIGEGGFIRIAAQMHPDVRIHCVREDGTVAVLVVDEIEDVLCWVDLETDGEVKDVVVLPGTKEDRVFYRVRREIDGEFVHYHEELARLDQCLGGDVNRQADSFVVGTGDVVGLDHLEGKEVVIWADGEDRGTATVSGGACSGHSYSNWVAGLGYTATYKTAKLSGQTQLGLSLAQYKRINSAGFVLDRTHAQGLEFGPDFDNMDPLPSVEDGIPVEAGEIYEHYEQEPVSFPGLWDPNSRMCLRANAPRPCTVLAAILNVDRQDSA